MSGDDAVGELAGDPEGKELRDEADRATAAIGDDDMSPRLTTASLAPYIIACPASLGN
jgi:hypothetical protein